MLVTKKNFKSCYDLFKHNLENGYSLQNVYCECTKAEYAEQLGCLPPLNLHAHGFMISEANTLDLHNGFLRHRGKYYCFICRAKDFAACTSTVSLAVSMTQEIRDLIDQTNKLRDKRKALQARRLEIEESSPYYIKED